MTPTPRNSSGTKHVQDRSGRSHRSAIVPAVAGSSPPPSPPRFRWRPGRRRSSSSGSRSPARRSSAPTPKGRRRWRSSLARRSPRPAPPASTSWCVRSRRSTSSTRASWPAIRRRARARPSSHCAASARPTCWCCSTAGALPVNALYDSSGAGAAFDVNMIPISAIERIEILKDGGSAIYGADAVSGRVQHHHPSRLPGRRGQPLLRQQQPQRRHGKARQPDRRLRRAEPRIASTSWAASTSSSATRSTARTARSPTPSTAAPRAATDGAQHLRTRPATWSIRTAAPTSACRIAPARRKASTPTTSAATTSTRAS